MKNLIIFIIILLPHFSFSQKFIENGKYFYHSENISSNYFDAPSYALDSVLFFYEKYGDTLYYWTISRTTAYDKKKFDEIKKQEEFGKTLQQGITLSDGRVTVHQLRPLKFIIRNDSLFQWSEMYKITEDSINSLTKEYKKALTLEDRNRLSNILEPDTEMGYVFIFSPNLLNENVQQHKVEDKRSLCHNTISLLEYWKIKDSRYFKFEITNKCGFWGHQWGFIVSDNFEFVSFGGYSSKETRLLTKERSKIK